MTDVSTIRFDLAKSVFQVHGVDEAGKAVQQCPVRLLLSTGKQMGWMAPAPGI
jgi:hypothetical protein